MRTAPRYFAVGTALFQEVSDEASLVADATSWLIQQQNSDGTWGGPDSLDRFISTLHSVMALLAVGFSPQSSVLSRVIHYLVNLDKEENVTFFYRAGALLNLKGYESVVKEDVEFLWKYRTRIGVHRDYPTFFFLLKLVRFASPKLNVNFSEQDVLKLILQEWDRDEGWYGRTSLTSMALALIYDKPFRNKEQIIASAKRFLRKRFVDEGGGSGYFDPNLVDDSFTIFNLCERDFLEKNEHRSLKPYVAKAVKHLVGQMRERKYWESPPPFGGAITSRIYPTAVVIRALLAYFTKEIPHFTAQIATALLDKEIGDYHRSDSAALKIKPFWGNINIREESDFCFMLMPFNPPRLKEIYERYIKKPIQDQIGIHCMRADDIYRSTPIMSDIWNKINEARFVIADLTDKNPNVFYELGIAHTLGKKVILISQTVEDIPFDLRPVRTIIYEDTLPGYDSLSEQLIKFIKVLGLD